MRVFLASLALLAPTTASQLVYDAAISSLFENFAMTFHKEYPTQEKRMERYEIFTANVERVAALNELHPHAKFSSLTRWADMSQDEYSQMHGLAVALDGPTAANYGCQFDDLTDNEVPLLSPTAEPQDSLDYVALGATVEVKDQGSCASCWAHATTAVVEARLKLDTGNITSLSEQFLLDCDPSRNCKGCCGGLSERSLQWLAGDSGLPGDGEGISSEEAYPYVSASGTDPTTYRCNSSAPLVATLTGFGVLSNPTEASMLAAVTEFGVLSVAMDASVLQFYTGGIITDYSGCGDSNNHAVAVVGYGSEDGVAYFKVRNSYGTDFGEEGYFRISHDAAEGCGIYNCVIAGSGANFTTTRAN